jgi:two-component system, OmpR family, alkaline phosphatase synthesis response regulator PhoP
MAKKILVIEDEQPVRINILDLLEAEGFETMGADNGEMGMALIREHEFDLIICDIMMPKLDGIAVLKALKEQQCDRVVPFIFLTAKSSRTDLREGMQSGAWDYITKPFKHYELLDAIRAQFEKVENSLHVSATQTAEVESLRHSVKQLEQLHEAKDQLLNKLIEELRNPLSTMNMSIVMLRHAKDQRERDRYLKIFKDEYSRELALINQFMDLKNLLTPENLQLMNRVHFTLEMSISTHQI